MMNRFRKKNLTAQDKNHADQTLPGKGENSSISGFPSGTVCVVEELAGGHAFNAHIIAMGITPGAEITIIQNSGHGPVLLNVRETRLALGRGEAEKIQARAV